MNILFRWHIITDVKGGGLVIKINKSALPSLIFAVLFLMICVIRFNENNWIDTGFYILAVIGFMIMFFSANRKTK